MHEKSQSQRVRGVITVLAALVFFAWFLAVGKETPYLFGLHRLPVGSTTAPRVELMAFYGVWSVMGSFVALLLTLGVSDLLGGRWFERLVTQVRRIPERWIQLIGVMLGLMIPALIRVIVLQGAPLTDDESAYRFSSQLLASGRLTASSLPDKLAFDRAFMVNDGTWYSQYFLGWPALMVPFVWLGISGFANSVYSGLTVLVLYGLARRLIGGRWAALSILIYLTSPMLMVAAATEMSHTSCLLSLLGVARLLLRTIDRPREMWSHAALALCFCVAFFIRPLTALGLGIPLLICWAVHWWRCGRNARVAIAFLAPSVVMGGLFLAVNTVQTGRPLKPAYQRTLEYVAENDYRFGHITEAPTNDFANLRLDPGPGVFILGVALLRLHFSLSGWPIGLLPIFLARRRKNVGWVWSTIVSFLAFHLFLSDSGIDTFGPVHFLELSGPLVLLTTMGIATATEWLGRYPTDRGTERDRLARLPIVAVGVLTALALLVFVPARLATVSAIAGNINRAFRTPAQLGLSNAVVFVYRPAVIYCASGPARGFVFWQPNPRPTLDDDVIWANHLSVDRDRHLMRNVFPERKAYLMMWTPKCKVTLFDLDQLPKDGVPDGEARGGRPILYRE